MTRGSNGLSPGAKYKRSKIASAVTSVALSLEYHGERLLGLAAQSLLGVPVSCWKKQSMTFVHGFGRGRTYVISMVSKSSNFPYHVFGTAMAHERFNVSKRTPVLGYTPVISVRGKVKSTRYRITGISLVW